MKRRKFRSEFKTKVVLESLKESSSIKLIAQKHSISPQQITNWKKEFISKAPEIFGKGKVSKKSEEEKDRDRLLRTIGELKVEVDFLKKTLK